MGSINQQLEKFTKQLGETIYIPSSKNPQFLIIKLKDSQDLQPPKLLIVIPKANTDTRDFLQSVQKAEQIQQLNQEEKNAIQDLKKDWPNYYSIKVDPESYIVPEYLSPNNNKADFESRINQPPQNIDRNELKIYYQQVLQVVNNYYQSDDNRNASSSQEAYLPPIELREVANTNPEEIKTDEQAKQKLQSAKNTLEGAVNKCQNKPKLVINLLLKVLKHSTVTVQQITGFPPKNGRKSILAQIDQLIKKSSDSSQKQELQEIKAFLENNFGLVPVAKRFFGLVAKVATNYSKIKFKPSIQFFQLRRDVLLPKDNSLRPFFMYVNMVPALPANSQLRIVFDYLKNQVALNPEPFSAQPDKNILINDINSLMNTIPEKESNQDIFGLAKLIVAIGVARDLCFDWCDQNKIKKSSENEQIESLIKTKQALEAILELTS